MQTLGRAIGRGVRWIIRSVVRLYYPTVEVTHRERIPATGPVLLVANHANSLIDPVMVGIASQRTVSFLAKASLFEVPVFGRALRAFGMLPAFRGSDDRSQVDKNIASFAVAAGVLRQGDAVGIFPEGRSHDSVKLAMIRSGAARIAMQAAQAGVTNLLIVPVGINYERKERFRSSVWIRVGNPIRLGEFLASHDGDERRTLRALTEEIGLRLRKTVIHLLEEDWEFYLNALEVFLPAPRGRGAARVSALQQRKLIADAINHFLAERSSRAEPVAALVKNHEAQLAKIGLSVTSPAVRWSGARLALHLVGASAWLLIGLVPAVAGTIHHFVPFFTVRWLAKLLQAPGKVTVSLTRLGLGVPIYGLWYAGVLWALRSYFADWVAWTCIVCMPFAGVFALAYWRQARNATALLFQQAKALLHRRELMRLRAEQKQIGTLLNELIAEYQKTAKLRLGKVDSQFIPDRSLILCVFLLAITAMVCWFSLGFGSRDASLPSISKSPFVPGALSPSTLSAQLESDEKTLRDIISGLRELEVKALQAKEDFGSGVRSYYKQADNDVIRQLLLSYLNYRTALVRTVWRYQNYDGIADERLRLRAFLCGLTAGTLCYETSLKFVVFFDHPEAVRKLNEAEPLWDIPAGVHETILRNVQSPELRAMLDGGFNDYDAKRALFAQHQLVETGVYAEFNQAIAAARAAIPQLQQKVAVPGVPWLRDSVKRSQDLFYDAKAVVSLWVGDTKVRSPRGGKALIAPPQLDEFRKVLKPGDILLERRNWFLSNAFLPGFWPHSALYVGMVEDLARLGLDKDPRVQRHWHDFVQRDNDGRLRVIIESISEGVVFTSLEHSIGEADSAAVLRPRLSDADLAECIAQAFSHLGKPYDFDFDFFSTDKLVCTELVFRAYDGKLTLPLVEVLGRRTMPAVEFVRKYCEEQEHGHSQLDFISFLDGDELKGRAFFRDEAAFKATLHRPALTWLQPAQKESGSVPSSGKNVK